MDCKSEEQIGFAMGELFCSTVLKRGGWGYFHWYQVTIVLNSKEDFNVSQLTNLAKAWQQYKEVKFYSNTFIFLRKQSVTASLL